MPYVVLKNKQHGDKSLEVPFYKLYTQLDCFKLQFLSTE